MKTALGLFAVLVGGMSGMAVTSGRPAYAVVYCEYIDYPANCVVRPGVRLVARPAVRAATVGVGAPGVGVRPGTPANRGGPVDRAGRR
jgi:hypothetical protein